MNKCSKVILEYQSGWPVVFKHLFTLLDMPLPSQYSKCVFVFYSFFFVHQPLLLTSPRTCWRPRPWPDRVEMFWSSANPGCLLGVSFHGGKGKRPWEKITGTQSCAFVCVCLVLSQSYFINLWFYVSLLGIHGLKEPSHSVTPRHLNCITRSARRHLASYVSSLDCTIVFCFHGSARSDFLQCLLEVIGRWRRVALGSMDWSISSLAACWTCRVIRGRGKQSRLPERWGGSSQGSAKGLINGRPQNIRSCVFTAVTPGRRNTLFY